MARSPGLLLFFLFCVPLFLDAADVTVDTAAELQSALDAANPGDTITLAANTNFTCSKQFTITRSGSATQRISITGVATSVVQCTSTSKNYLLHIDGASYITVRGMSFKTGQKGVIIDNGSYNILDSITLSNIGQEAVHFRDGSSYNVIQNSLIIETGVVDAQYGEGVYVGSDKSQWSNYNASCDYNQIINNRIGPNVRAEGIDIKEGTVYTLIQGNTFNASGIQGKNYADSWVDVKGNNCTLTGNTGYQAGVVSSNQFYAGFQTHNNVAGWGYGNTFTNNVGYFEASFDREFIDITDQSNTNPNVVCSNNQMMGGQGKISNIPTIVCTSTATLSPSASLSSSPSSSSSTTSSSSSSSRSSSSTSSSSTSSSSLSSSSTSSSSRSSTSTSSSTTASSSASIARVGLSLVVLVTLLCLIL